MKRSRYILFLAAFISLSGFLSFVITPTVMAVCSANPTSEAYCPTGSDRKTPTSSQDDDEEKPEIKKVTDPALEKEANCNKDNCELITKYVNPIISMLAGLVGVAAVIGIIWGGIQISTSASDPQKMASGKNHIQNAIIALVAFAILYAFLSWLIPGGFL